jgi:hypothetical protein
MKNGNEKKRKGKRKEVHCCVVRLQRNEEDEEKNDFKKGRGRIKEE